MSARRVRTWLGGLGVGLVGGLLVGGLAMGCTSVREAPASAGGGGADGVAEGLADSGAVEVSDGPGASSGDAVPGEVEIHGQSDVGPADGPGEAEGDDGPGALELAWVTAPATFADAPAGAEEAMVVLSAVAFDDDLDGDLDVVLGTSTGLRVLENRGPVEGLRLREVFDPLTLVTAPAIPGGVMEVRALVAAAGEVVACTSAGRDLRLGAAVGGLAAGEWLPWRRGTCVDVAVSEGGAVARLVAVDDVVALHGVGEEESLLSPGSSADVGWTGESADNEAELIASWSLAEAAQGHGAARLDYALSGAGPVAIFTLPVSLPSVPDRIELMLRTDGGPVEVKGRLLAAAGPSHEGPVLEDSTDWTLVSMDDVGTWGPPDSDIVALQLQISTQVEAALSGWLEVDLITAWRDGHAPWLVEDFERPEPRHVWADAGGIVAGDVDGDGQGDLLVRREDEIRLLVSHGAAPGGLSAGGAVGLPAPGGALVVVDVNTDGAADLVRVGGEQDRLWIGDGWGHFVDATAGSLPTDWSDGTSVAAEDLDRDGAVDLVVGNDGATDRLYVGRGDGRFLDATPALGFDAMETVAVLVVDVDGDGALDVVSVSRDGASPPNIRLHVGGQL